MNDTTDSVFEAEGVNSSVTNPNYTSVRNTRPRPPAIQLGDGSKEYKIDRITDLGSNPNSPNLVLTDSIHGAHSSSRRRKFSKRLNLPDGNKSPNSNENNRHLSLADIGIVSPTKADHMGIFQFMKFDPEHMYDKTTEGEVDDDDADLTSTEKLKHILHSKALHIIIIILVVIDVFLVLFEVLFDLGVLHHEEVREIFHGFSIGILSMFMIEISLKLLVDHSHFLRHKIELFDALVVIVSWVVDVILVFIPNTGLLAVELLLLLRLWRVVRIINGIILAIKTEADERVHFFKHLNHELESSLQKAEEDVKRLNNDVEILMKQLKDHNIDIKQNRI